MMMLISSRSSLFCVRLTCSFLSRLFHFLVVTPHGRRRRSRANRPLPSSTLSKFPEEDGSKLEVSALCPQHEASGTLTQQEARRPGLVLFSTVRLRGNAHRQWASRRNRRRLKANGDSATRHQSRSGPTHFAPHQTRQCPSEDVPHTAYSLLC